MYYIIYTYIYIYIYYIDHKRAKKDCKDGCLKPHMEKIVFSLWVAGVFSFKLSARTIYIHLP